MAIFRDVLRLAFVLSSLLYARASEAANRTYAVNVTQRDAVLDGASLISRINGSCDFNYSFNTAWFPAPAGSLYSDGLIVRVVECNPNHHSCAGVAHPEWTNAGALTIVAASIPSDAPPTAERVTASNVSWAGASAPPHGGTVGLWGAADPRVATHPTTGEYYLTWDNCTQNCFPQRTTLLSTTRDPFNASAWTFHGPLLGEKPPYTGGAALLLRPSPPHYAFIGNSDTAAAILLATSPDGLNWTLASGNPWMTGRSGMWDAPGVAPAGQPSLLSTGDFLFIYNVDTGFPYHPNPLGRCAVGWAVLNGTDPTIIVARSDAPLLVPTLPWETCGGESGKGPWPMCQEPEVVFSTGMKPLGGDEFLVLYGAADSVVGTARIAVTST